MTRLLTFLLLAAGPAGAQVTVSETPGRVALASTDIVARIELGTGALYLERGPLTFGPFTAEATVGATVVTSASGPAPSYSITDVSDALGNGKLVTVSFPRPPHVLEVGFALRESLPGVTVRLGVRPGVDATIASFALTAPAGAVDGLGIDQRALAEAHQSWDVPFAGPRALAPTAEGLAALWSPATDLTLTLGGLTAKELVTIDVAATLRITARGPKAIVVAGSRADSDLLAMLCAAGANSALEAHADAVARLAGVATATTRPMWGWMSWYAYASADETILALAADGLATLDRGRGEAVLLEDDGWQDRLGDWQAGSRFPSGMAALATRAHDRILKAGLWVAPFGAAESSSVAITHPDWMVQDGASPHVIETRPEWGGRIYRLDPSRPEVIAFLEALVSRVTRDWGFDVVKLDFLDWGLVEASRALPGSDPRAAFRDALAAFRRGLRPGAKLLLSGMPLGFAAGVVAPGEGVRTSPDAMHDERRHRESFRASARRAHWNRSSYDADADVLMARASLAVAEARRRATFLAMVGGPLFLGDTFWWEPQERQDLIARTVPPHSRRGRAIDIFTSDVPALYELELANGARAVAGLDHESHAVERILRTSPDRRPRLVYDVWRDRAYGVMAGPAALAVATADAALLIATPVDTTPQVIASDGHLITAAVEVEAQSYAAPRLAITLTGPPNATRRVLATEPPGLVAVAAFGATLNSRGDGIAEATVLYDASGRAQLDIEYGAHAETPPPSGRPAGASTAEVRVVGEESVIDAAALQAIVAEARAGVMVVVTPPPDPAPFAPRVVAMPWVEVTVRDHRSAALPDSLAATLALALGLGTSDNSGVLLNLRPGVDPGVVSNGTRFDRATHGVLLCGEGAVFRLGRIDPALTAAAIQTLQDTTSRAAVRVHLRAARRLLQLQRDAETLDGAWRFTTDPSASGDALGYALPAFDDSAWTTIPVPGSWESAGHPGYDGVAWYRRPIVVPPAWAAFGALLEAVAIDDEDITFAGGVEIGRTTSWSTRRRYPIPPALLTTGGTTLAVRVNDRGQGGGLVGAVTLAPDPDAVAAALTGGDLFAFVELDGLDPAGATAILFATRSGDDVRLTAAAGAPTFRFERGDFPRFDSPTLLGTTELRSLRDRPAGNAAYRVGR